MLTACGVWAAETEKEMTTVINAIILKKMTIIPSASTVDKIITVSFEYFMLSQEPLHAAHYNLYRFFAPGQSSNSTG